MLRYLSLDIVSSSKLSFLLETDMPVDKYLSIFSCQMGAIIYLWHTYRSIIRTRYLLKRNASRNMTTFSPLMLR